MIERLQILIKFPTRQRPDKFFSVLDRYVNYLEDSENTKFIISCDEDDMSMNNDFIKDKLNKYKNLNYYFSKNSSKVEAINNNMEENGNSWDICILASDDMIPQIKGYDNIIREKMLENFNDTDGILWFYDGHQKEINTLTIIGKKYYNRFDYLYNPQYKSLWCDVELTDVGNILEKQIFIDECIIRHEHNTYGYEQNDQLYDKNSLFYDSDKVIYDKRKINGFGLVEKRDILDSTILLKDWSRFIEESRNFSFVKFGDGELECMVMKSGSNCDNHQYSSDLAEKLMNSYEFLTKLDNIYLGEWHSGFNVIKQKLKLNKKINLASFEILLTRNLTEEKFNFFKIIKYSKRKKFFIGPERLNGVKNFLNIDSMITIPLENCFTEYDNVFNELKTDLKDNNIYLFSSGMMSKSLIGELLKINENITCLDVGSGFDIIFFGKTREGQNLESINFYSELIENKKKNFSVFVNTTDSYEDCWFPFFTLYEKYLNIPNKIYLNTETKEYNFKNLVSLKNGLVNKKWTDCLIHSLQLIDEDYILYLQDDYFLTKKVDIKELNRLYDLFLDLDLDCLHLTQQNTVGPFKVNESDLWEIPLETEYRISTQSAFWKKSSLLKYILPNKTGWEFEIESFNRVNEQPLKIYGLNRYKFDEIISYVSATGIIKGKWNEKIYEVFEFNNIDVDFSKR